jgi:hypothetical protein
MGHADLDHGAARGLQLDEQLGREEGALGLEVDALEDVAPEQLAGAVDVGDAEAEEDPVGQSIRPGIDRPDERVGALDAIARDDIGSVRRGVSRGQSTEVRDAELAVAVREGHELVARRAEAGPQRRPVAAVHRVVHGPNDAGVCRGQLVGDDLGPVPRSVVDDDDLERLGEGRKDPERLLDESRDVGLLVVGREEVGEPRHARRRSARRVGSGRCLRGRRDRRHSPASRRATTRVRNVASSPSR